MHGGPPSQLATAGPLVSALPCQRTWVQFWLLPLLQVQVINSRSWVVEPPGTSRQAPEARLRKVDPDKVHCVVVPALQGNCTTGPPDAVVLAWAMHRPLCLATNCRWPSIS